VQTLTESDLIRAARAFPVKVKAISSSIERLKSTPFPALAIMRDGGVMVVGKCANEGVLCQRLEDERPLIRPWGEFEEQWTGRLILIVRRAKSSDLHRRFDLSWFWGAIQKYRHVMYEVLLASFFIQFFALITPMIFQVVIDKVLVHRGMSTLEVLVAGLAIVSLFDVLLGGLRTYLSSHTSNRIDVELGARIFKHLVTLPLNYFQARRVGDSVARVREIETIRQFLTGSTLTLILDLIFGIIFIGVMFLYSSVLAWIVVATIPLYVTLAIVVTPIFRSRLEEKFRLGAENQAFLVESVTGIETIKAMAVEPIMQRKWEDQLAAYVGASFRTQVVGNVASQLSQLLSKVTTVLTLLVGAKLVINNDLTVGELVAFNMLSQQVTGPVLRLAGLYQEFHQVRISVDRLGDILNTQPEPRPSAQAAQGGQIMGDIRLERVAFRYRPDAQPVLSDVNIEIPAGQVIGVVGPSGSGKSTIAKLVQRLYVPEQGQVLIDGRDISLADPAWLRRQIGVVLQENVLFNQTVRENIALAMPAATLAQVVEAAELAGAHEFIGKMTKGYDTMIGERGASLSGGQRQRIAIARALLGNPRILIFDEATSALDYESESIIQSNMRDIVKGRTVIIIAHRLSTVRSADRIITIENGRIVEDGPHDELISAKGRYASLHRLQSVVGH
jgi:subfamily B ATP-binding cassette protein HlyB/CyaB